MRLRLLVLLGFQFFLLSAYAQFSKSVNRLDTVYQECLDKGDDMLGCTVSYYKQMDSMLNVVYNHLRSSCDSVQKIALKKEQLDWLKKRDKYFGQTAKEYLVGNPVPLDDRMTMMDMNAAFVRERVLLLYGKSASEYKSW